MTVADLKLKIFRRIDSLEKSRLEEFYGIMENFINGQRDTSDWDKLTREQQDGILNAIDEIGAGKGISHNKVMEKVHQRFQHV